MARADEGCALGPVVRLLEGVGARGSLALALSDEGGLVVLASEGTISARPLSLEGAPLGEASRSEAPDVRGLAALTRLGDRHLLLSREPCSAAASCLVARTLSARGEVVGTPDVSPLPAPIRTARRASAGGPFFFAWSTTGGARAVERYVISEDGGIERRRLSLGDEPATAEQPVEILGLVADGTRWAALWRRGPAEDTRSRVFLGGEGEPRVIEALREALAVDAIALEGDTLSLITTFEMARPHYLRFALGEDAPRDARELSADAPIPAPLTERERVELDADAGGLYLRRKSPAGYPIGARVAVTEGAVASAAIARAGDAIFVAWLAEGAVYGRRVRCAP